MFLEINGKKIGPYEAIKNSSGEIKGDILPILYDNATIELRGASKSYSLCYKKSKNLFGKKLVYADLVDEKTGEAFSFQVSNIYLLKIIKSDIFMIARVGDKIKFYSDFGRKELNIESDGDKTDLTPLGYYDIFITYDDNYFYPLFLDGGNHRSAIRKFYDYYGFKAYTDSNGINHLFMLIEHSSSTEQRPIWYFVDNFENISEALYFDDYVEVWDIDADGDIIMTTTSMNKYYLEVGKSKKIVYGVKPERARKKAKELFLFTRAYEDTDTDYIVGEREEGYFIISKLDKDLSEKKQKEIVYYKEFLSYDKQNKLFVMQNKSSEVVLLNIFGEYVLTTDLLFTDKIKEIIISDDKKIISIKVNDEGAFRKYVV